METIGCRGRPASSFFQSPHCTPTCSTHNSVTASGPMLVPEVGLVIVPWILLLLLVAIIATIRLLGLVALLSSTVVPGAIRPIVAGPPIDGRVDTDPAFDPLLALLAFTSFA